MMRLRIIALLLLIATGASAQEMRRLNGYVQIPGQEISKYFIQISITGTKISGYSITEDHGNRLRAMVSGSRDPESEMTLEESKADNPGYCYFTAKLKLTVVSGRMRWAGPFESHESGGRLCGKGFMTLLDEAPAPDAPPVKSDPPKPRPVVVAPTPKPALRQLPKPIPAPVKAPAPVDTPKPRPKPVVIDTPKPKPIVAQPPQPKPKPVVMQAPEPKPQRRNSDSCTREYAWQSDSLTFEVWDGWTLDGDVVSIIVDGKRMMDHHKLGLNRERFALYIGRGRHKLDLEFHEEGTEPPNTPNMILFDGSKRYELNISGATGEKVRICVDR
jgi:hypothetical protein